MLCFDDQVIARIVDGSQFHEFKAVYGTSIVTGFCAVAGLVVCISLPSHLYLVSVGISLFAY